MPASQHQSPKSDIEISQAATKRRILDIAIAIVMFAIAATLLVGFAQHIAG